MRGRLLFGILIVLSLVAGYPYAGYVVNRSLGTGPVTFVEHDGTSRTLIKGPDAPRPDWLPLMPSSLLVTAGHWMPGPAQSPAGDVELLSHAGREAIESYYLDALREAGFTLRDIGIAPLSAPEAALLGQSGTLIGWRRDSGLKVTVQISTRSGLIIPSRLVQIHWTTLEPARLDAALRQWSSNTPIE